MDSDNDSERHHLVDARQRAYESAERRLFALSGGALGVSLLFIDRVIGDTLARSPHLLFWAWLFWVVSLATVLFAHYSSCVALTRAIQELDESKRTGSRPGGLWSRATEILNLAGGVLFLGGLVSMMWFAWRNLEVTP